MAFMGVRRLGESSASERREPTKRVLIIIVIIALVCALLVGGLLWRDARSRRHSTSTSASAIPSGLLSQTSASDARDGRDELRLTERDNATLPTTTTMTTTTSASSSASPSTTAITRITPSPPPPTETPNSSLATAPLRFFDDMTVNNNGPRITTSQGVITSQIYANASSGRSEMTWRDEARQHLTIENGDDVTVSFDVRPNMEPQGAKAPPGKIWNVVFQMHGALQDGSWSSAPPLTLEWQDGSWYVRGAYVVKQSDGSLRHGQNFSIRAPSPATNTVWHRWKFTVYTAGPGRGWISAWHNDAVVLDHYVPPSGTFYDHTGAFRHTRIQLKSGIYSSGGSVPWLREMQHRNVQLSRTRAGVTKHWGF